MASKSEPIYEKKPRKMIVECLFVSLEMLVYALIFMVFGFIFVADTINNVIKFILGIFFFAPPLILEFTKGKNLGEKMYKRQNRAIVHDIHEKSSIKLNYFQSLIYPLPFVCLAMFLIILAEIVKNNLLQGVMLLLFIPTYLIFLGVGAIPIKGMTWLAVLSVGIMVFAMYAAFVAGYVYALIQNKRRTHDVINEIRSFE